MGSKETSIEKEACREKDEEKETRSIQKEDFIKETGKGKEKNWREKTKESFSKTSKRKETKSKQAKGKESQTRQEKLKPTNEKENYYQKLKIAKLHTFGKAKNPRENHLVSFRNYFFKVCNIFSPFSLSILF